MFVTISVLLLGRQVSMVIMDCKESENTKGDKGIKKVTETASVTCPL